MSKQLNKIWFGIGLLILLSFSYQTPSYFVQFKIHTLSSNDQAIDLDKKMVSKSGIVKSRADYKTSTYFCAMKPGVLYTEDEFTKWFKKLGYKISCFNAGIQGQDRMVTPYELEACEPVNE